MADLPNRISESQISHILERAAEIDAAGHSVTVDELRSIAAEAGIGADATEDAIQELFGSRQGLQFATAGAPTALAVATAPPSVGRIMAGGAVGLAAGLMRGLDSVLMPLYGPNLFALGGLAGAAAYLAWRALQSMKRDSQLDFQLQNLALWFGAAAGVTVSVPILADDAIGGSLLMWLVVALAGGMLIKFGRKEQRDGGVTAPLARLTESDGGRQSVE